jgi:hypothetical protein
MVQSQSGHEEVQKTHLNQCLGIAEHACHPSYAEKHKKEDRSTGQPGHKMRPYLKNNQCNTVPLIEHKKSTNGLFH